ncbi:MAG: hypothetical protein QNI84_14090 [Henriciella sp.]|nr:hypothetical protein [Henriciella sp.]
MSVKYLSINDGEMIPIDMVKRVSTIEQIERESLSRLGDHVDPYRFNTKVEIADGSKSYAPESVSDISKQGVGLVAVTESSFVPSANITKAKNITEADRARFNKSTGRPLSEGFVSQIETKAGMVLSTEKAETVLDRRAQVTAQARTAPQSSQTEKNNMGQARDAVMAQVPTTQPQQNSQTRVQSPEPGREL